MNSEKPFFSVIIPCYNYGHTVSRAIQSILFQPTHCKFDITVVDDASSDNSADIIASFVEENPNTVRYIYQRNSGPAAARNQGIDSTEGEYLIFLDADDELTPQAFTIFHEAATANPDARLIIGGHDSQHENGKRRYHSPGDVPANPIHAFHRYLQNRLGMANGAIAMKRDVFDSIRYCSELRQSEDIPVFAAIFANYPVITVDRSTAIIYRHEGSLRSNTDWAEKMGFKMVDEVFNHRLPSECYQYERWYRSQKGLSLFRMQFLAGNQQHAKDYYHQAISLYPKNVLRWAYLRKYLRMRLGLSSKTNQK